MRKSTDFEFLVWNSGQNYILYILNIMEVNKSDSQLKLLILLNYTLFWALLLDINTLAKV